MKMNINFFKELSMYIAAGKKKLDNVTTVDIPALKTTAQQSGLAEDAQKANDLENMANRFEKTHLRLGADAQHFAANGAADTSGTKQRLPDGGKNSVFFS
jgi:uncharacterized protein YaaN involved in tellurite resistance